MRYYLGLTAQLSPSGDTSSALPTAGINQWQLSGWQMGEAQLQMQAGAAWMWLLCLALASCAPVPQAPRPWPLGSVQASVS